MAVYNDPTAQPKQLLAQTINVVLNTNIAEVRDFLVSYDGSTFVNIQWTSTQENSLDKYQVERQDAPTAPWAIVVSDITQQGPSDYGPVQDVPGSGTFKYRLVAVFADQTPKEVALFPSDIKI